MCTDAKKEQYKCEDCGKTVETKSTCKPPECCGKPMKKVEEKKKGCGCGG